MSAELLRKAADLIEQRAAPDRALSRPLDAVFDQWSLGPQVATPIVAWLRDGAERLAETTKLWTDYRPTGVYDDEPPPRHTPEQIRRNVEHHWKHELAFARGILGEATP